MAIEVHSRNSYQLGFGKSVTRNSLSKANENRDYRIFEEFAYNFFLGKTPVKELFANIDINYVKERINN